MKSSLILKPLVLAVATSMMAVGAFAETASTQTGGAHAKGSQASVVDVQINHDNFVKNAATENTASIDGSLDSAAGNVGANVAAGDNNQQANAAAISTADADFVFGLFSQNASAQASVSVDQQNYDNVVFNHATQNNATLNDSANSASGNVGINVAAGTSNQQKNDLAIANNATAYVATASSDVSQDSYGNKTINGGTAVYENQQVSLTLSGQGTYSGQSDQIGDVYPDTWTGPAHTGGIPSGHIDLDSDVQGAQDLNDDGGALAFNEAGTLELSGSISGNLPVLVSIDPTVNNAGVTGSLNGAAGNVGLNVAAGSGNQQSNSLALAAGCNACVPTPTPGGGE